MKWPLQPIWEGQDVFVLGGGPSVRKFSIQRLVDCKVVGCNDSYLFGASVVDVLVFGDILWWHSHKTRPAFRKFSNPIITCHPKLQGVSGLIWAPRETSGFHTHSLGWNGNTGSAAINVALLLGARRIFLVGFDMSLDGESKSNWHPNPLTDPTPGHYKRYVLAMRESLPAIKAYWPDTEIFNLNPESEMDLFPKKTLDEVLQVTA